MKILWLKIKTPDGEVKENIGFEKVGVSFVYGDIQKPEDQGATINSLGKTLLLKFIDYIFGANEDPKIIKEDIHGYELEAMVLNDGSNYIVRRKLGDSEFVYINNKAYTLTDYKNYFGIKRALYAKQFILKKKSTEISYGTNPNKDDVASYLELLQLTNILDDVKNIYDSQDKIKSLKASKKELVSFYGNVNIKQIDVEIYFIDKEVDRVSKQLIDISDKIKTIQVADIQKNIVKEYADKSRSLKRLKAEYEKNRLECERLIEFIENSNKTDVTSEHILAIYKKAKLEVPDMVKKDIRDVEMFHKKVYEERKVFLNEKKNQIQEKINSLKIEYETLALKLDRIGVIISMNEVYQESIGLYEKYNSDLQELKYRQGKLSQVKSIDNNIETEDNKLTKSFKDVNQIRKTYDDLIQAYRDFIYAITKNIYDNDVNSFFDIKVRPKHMSTRPISFEFNLKRDTGEGVNEVKKNLMDFLLCRYNSYMELMIQDSACFNGIDPRQVSGMLKELNEIAVTTNKQVIVAINKYQIGGHDETIKMVEKQSAIILSEEKNLLGIAF